MSARSNLAKTDKLIMNDKDYAYYLFINKLRRMIYSKMRATLQHIQTFK